MCSYANEISPRNGPVVNFPEVVRLMKGVGDTVYRLFCTVYILIVFCIAQARSVDQCRRRWKQIMRDQESSQTIVTSHRQDASTTDVPISLDGTVAVEAGAEWMTMPMAIDIWSAEEDERLYNGAVNLFFTPGPTPDAPGTIDWDGVSNHVGSGRTATQCYERWAAALAASTASHTEEVNTVGVEEMTQYSQVVRIF